ncbi:hypothetical protein O0235_00280 [Tepidiforma flava]|uniref:Uncharacterized protein n=1 Tax=Tepidiforma flava TaxID=3004094 RepID=A0ABY7M7V3_9CHLR|nr:hypothetical protein [Tepidiforma flava]WBL36103.1 hypothetical protein O0235_00280 [Tepidiforma flava]
MSFLYGERLSCGRLEFGGDEPRTPPHALPGDRPVWPPDRLVDILHVKIEVQLDVDAKKVRGTVTHTVAPLNDGTRFVAFDAVDMVVSGVTVGRREAAFDYDGARLTVDLGEGRKRGQELQVAIAYEASPRIGMYFIGPDEGTRRSRGRCGRSAGTRTRGTGCPASITRATSSPRTWW